MPYFGAKHGHWGEIARLDGRADFLRTAKEHPVGTFFASMDTAIMGCKTLEAGLRMTGGKLPKTAMKTYVMSQTKEPGERDGVTLVNDSPEELVARIRERNGSNNRCRATRTCRRDPGHFPGSLILQFKPTSYFTSIVTSFEPPVLSLTTS